MGQLTELGSKPLEVEQGSVGRGQISPRLGSSSMDKDIVPKGSPEYVAHKKKRFKSLDQNVAKSGAFTIDDENIRKQFETE